ncbi:MAG: regulatory protein RecX [Actinomycetota bacterium]
MTEDYRALMERAGSILARRAHSRHELVQKLGGPEELRDAVLERLEGLGLVDDEAFARAWIEERSSKKGREALLHELEAKGVVRETAEAVWEQIAPDEAARAIEIASKHLRKVSRKPLAVQAAAIHGLLVRRGFSAEVAEEATRAVLPPEGWD